MRVTGGAASERWRRRAGRMGASWSPSGDIVFAAERGANISRVAETGGDPVVIRQAQRAQGLGGDPLAARASRRAPLPVPGPQRRSWQCRASTWATLGRHRCIRATGACVVRRFERLLRLGPHRVRASGAAARPAVRPGRPGARPARPFPSPSAWIRTRTTTAFALFALSGNGVLDLPRRCHARSPAARGSTATGKVVGRARTSRGEFRDLAMSRDGRLVAYEQMDPHLGHARHLGSRPGRATPGCASPRRLTRTARRCGRRTAGRWYSAGCVQREIAVLRESAGRRPRGAV